MLWLYGAVVLPSYLVWGRGEGGGGRGGGRGKERGEGGMGEVGGRGREWGRGEGSWTWKGKGGKSCRGVGWGGE